MPNCKFDLSGFVATMLDESTTESAEPEQGNTRTDLVRLSVMAVAAVVCGIGSYLKILPFDILAIAATLVGGYPVYKETLQSLRHGHVNMEVSMTVAIFECLILGQFTVSVVITFFVLLSEYIETYAVDKGRQTIVLLEKSAPKLALVRRGGSEVEVDAGSLVPGRHSHHQGRRARACRRNYRRRVRFRESVFHNR